jgi:hypothetical protein
MGGVLTTKIIMKIQYKTCDLTTESGLKLAEKLHENGWVINYHTPFSIQFYRV